MKTKYAVIIKHPYRENDYRVDIIEIEENDWTYEQIEKQIYLEMLGPFEVVSITGKVDLNREFPYLKTDKSVEL